MEGEKTLDYLAMSHVGRMLLRGHSHQHIADQLVRIIKDDADRHIIGVEGGWGSGKSNLISLVNKGLNGKNVYDKDELFIGCAMRDDAGHAMGFYRLRWRLDS